MTSLRVALACQEAAGLQTLRRVVDRGHRVVAVFTDPTREPSGAPGVAGAAGELGLDVRDARLVRDPGLGDWLRDERVDVLLNVHSLYLVAEAVVEAPSIGSFNLHPGPLPGFPGLNAPSWAVYERRTRFGCTVHWMNAAIDAGLLAYEAAFPVGERDTGLTLAARCGREGLALLDRLLDDLERDPSLVPRRAQQGPRVDRGPGPPNGGRVDWTLPAETIEALVRACDYGPFRSPWGKARLAVDGSELALVRAQAVHDASAGGAAPGAVLAVEGDTLTVAAGNDTVLRVARLERDGTAVAPASVVGAGAVLA